MGAETVIGILSTFVICSSVEMAAYSQTQYSPAIQPAGPYPPYTHHTQGYSMPSYSEYLLPHYSWTPSVSDAAEIRARLPYIVPFFDML